MTVFVFEGPDNLGKGTIIKSLVDEYKNVRDICMIHFTGPRCENGEDPFEYQKQIFASKVKKIITLNQYNKLCGKQTDDIIILDRSWIGEYVYGQIYRGGDPEKILDMVNEYNIMLNTEGIKTIFVRLDANPDFIIYHDDNKSFTSEYGATKRFITVSKERDLFIDIFNKMNIGSRNTVKMSVFVQDINSDSRLFGKYRTVESICNQIKLNAKNMGVEI